MGNEPQGVALSQIKKLVDEAKKKRINRYHCDKSFCFHNTKDGGLILSEDKSAFDRVVLEKSRNEMLEYVGFDRNGSHMQLSLSIWSMFPNPQKPDEESDWRMAHVKFLFVDATNGCRYSYETQQLLDYGSKRNKSTQHDVKNVYKIGSVSVEVVTPFAFSRILFSGIIKRTNIDNGSEDQVSARMSISTHPTCDKFDYQYKFNRKYLTNSIDKCEPKDLNEIQYLLRLALCNRIDQAIMFQAQMKHLDATNAPSGTQQFTMWGGKLNLVVNPFVELNGNSCEYECLVLWAECGHVIHLNRSLKYPNLLYGMVHNNFDYSDSLYECKLMQKINDNALVELKFDQLDSFSSLCSKHVIKLISFEKKSYTIEFESTNNADTKFDSAFKIKVNNFNGWATTKEMQPKRFLEVAHASLWTIDIDNSQMTQCMSNEQLLGGKGNSLIELDKLTKQGQFLNCGIESEVSVPRGLVVSCVAHRVWLESNPLILDAIHELDRARRSLAARSFYTNPMSDKYLTPAQGQQLLRKHCQEACLTLKSCPLPPTLRQHIYSKLAKIFGESQLRNPDDTESADDESKVTSRGILFAVRSSAVGEDTIETSAAGQMRTILDARGFDSICSAIVDCWTSQYELEAVTYKSQNGLALDLPMAVVVQELIDCDVAGVAATCDPLSGSKSELQILANPGLGEGVVSGKQTDTIRVPVRSLAYNLSSESHEGSLVLDNIKDNLVKVSDSGERQCCLSDEQIVSLANLLLRLRHLSTIKDREIEWAMTKCVDNEHKLHIHLLQSRPLTHLHKLDSFEIDHENDYGQSSPLDIVSRANIAEVMPGSLCPMTSTYFMPVCMSFGWFKPYGKHHTKQPFTSDMFTFHCQMAMLVLTSTDMLVRMPQQPESSDDDFRRETMDMMMGTGLDSGARSDKLYRLFIEERRNPNVYVSRMAFIANTLLKLKQLRWKSERAERVSLVQDLTKLDDLIEQLDKPSAERDKSEAQSEHSQQSSDKIETNIEADIEKLYERISEQTHPLVDCWQYHTLSTMVSVIYNSMCMKVFTQQPSYPSLNSAELLSDFSVLARGDGSTESTESGEISTLLIRLTEILSEEGELERVKSMDYRQLYTFLTSSSSKSVPLFEEFFAKNGHRAYKEFDLATLTWADDPSYIMKSLVLRLKQHSVEQAARERDLAKARVDEHNAKVDQILAKIVKNKAFLTKFAVPQAKKAVVKREQSKSRLIKLVHCFRVAIRHLGALLCLAGRLPDAQIVFWLTIQELHSLVTGNEEHRGEWSRLLYKARRRQQRARAYNLFTFPKPTMTANEMLDLYRGVTMDRLVQGAAANSQTPNGSDESDTSVRGMTSCGGCVTGRVCVVNSIEDMDQIEPNDIMITYSIDTSWTVYFFTISGIVTEVGGIVSHGAVVAREYGIPTLCTAVGACSKFKTGQIVTLNADQGICYLASDTLS